MNKPNFFLLGAGRSGSTYLYNLLKQHPDIFLSDPKEPSFFCETFQVVKNPVDYFQLFCGAGQAKVIGEASHVYMSNPKTAPLLKLLFPQARFLVTLRNPVDRAYSLYQWMRRFGHEELDSFEKALDVEEDRFTSESFAKNAPHYFYNSLYFRSGLCGEQLSRYFDSFSQDQFLILNFDDVTKRPKHNLKRIFNFLDVDKSFETDLKVRQNKGVNAF